MRIGYDFRIYQEEGFGPGAQAGQYDFSTSYTRQFDNSSGGRHRPAAGGLHARAADRRLHRPQRRAHELPAVPRRVRPGRLDGQRQADGEPRAALRVRERDPTRADEPQPARLGSGGDAGHHGGRPGGLRAPTRSRRSRRRPSACAAASSSPTTATARFWNADRNNFQPRARLRLQDRRQDRVARRRRRSTPCRSSSPASARSGFSQATNIVPTNDTGLTFVANLANPFPAGVAAPPGAQPRRQHVPRTPARPLLAGGRRQERPERPVGLHGAARAARAVARRTRLRRQPRVGPARGDADQPGARASTWRRPGRATRPRSTTSPPTSPTPSPACCRARA